jgi:uncharacterized NAD(P)/FAD-binding protein YdhS
MPIAAPRAGGVPTVAIVGGGCAGTLVAAHLLRRDGEPLRIVMIERRSRFGPGVAYSTADPQHLLNVVAERMSAFSDEPLHFLEWAAERLGTIERGSYLPRRLYGEYLEAVLAEACVRAAPQRMLELVNDEVVSLRRGDTGIELRLASREDVACDFVVLATGPPDGAGVAQLPSDPRVVLDPWAPAALECARRPGTTLVLGSGLSAVDVALSLCSRQAGAAFGGRQGGRVLALSRGGRWPAASLPGPRAAAPAMPAPRGPIGLAELERMLRSHARGMQRQGYDWRDVIDGLRPVTQQLWKALAPAHRELFLRERRRAWDIRRHRMAPATGSRLRELASHARIASLMGTVIAVRPAAAELNVDLALDGASRVRTVSCGCIVVCTGPGMDIRRTGSSLLDALLADGVASPDPLALGLHTTPNGVLVDARGRPDVRLLTLGALRRGELWETTAVPEIRAQAEALAITVERSLGLLNTHRWVFDTGRAPMSLPGLDLPLLDTVPEPTRLAG